MSQKLPALPTILTAIAVTVTVEMFTPVYATEQQGPRLNSRRLDAVQCVIWDLQCIVG